VTIGLGIVLPASFLDWSRPRLRIVLAHELAHVRQRDFYLQLLAQVHTAIFWFSPAAWWIQKHLSDLGEAISDFAGITEANDAPSYAELLLEVAALPRQPLFAVAMARSSRIEHRIDRLLVDRLFRRSFVEGRGRALAVAAIVPLVLTASASLVAVRAAARVTPATRPIIHVVAQDSDTPVAIPDTPASAPKLPVAQLPNVKLKAPATEEPAVEVSSAAAVEVSSALMAAQANPPAVTVEHDSDTYFSDSDQDSFMIVNGDKSQMFNFHGDYGTMEALRKKLHGNYILVERSGKYYVIDDPALMEQARQLFAPMEELGRQQENLGAQQEKLGEEQARLGEQQEQAHIETPDMSKEIAELQEAVKQLQDLEKNKTVTQGDLASVQGRIGSIEGRIGEMQGRIGTQEGELGRQQGELGAKQGALGAQQGKLGAEQGRIARRASRQMRSMIDQAFQSGKAKPVD
jgi:BlaR1 peptidase M56